MLNAYQRPLFRQAGGPAGVTALPAPPPAGVASLPQQDPQALLSAAEGQVSSGMEGVGRDYVINMINRLDTAENFKQVIDSMRGNEMPMEERYGELAEYVGEDDAEKTPESVLAMVQPVIMMTEEGNVDSGIGELMQGVAGEVDMMTEDGQLTDMGQGVGSLMAANQGPLPPQQFADGGAVQHFANGGPPGVNFFSDPYAKALGGFAPPLKYDPEALTSGYEQRLPLYMGIMDPEKERQMTKSQIMFDIAQAGLNFAGGVDPRTGQSMTQLPMGAQLATAAGGLPGQIGARIAGQRQSEQAAKLAALGAAEKQLTAREAAISQQRAIAAGTLGDLARTGVTEKGMDTRQVRSLDASMAELLEREGGADRRLGVQEAGLRDRLSTTEAGMRDRLNIGNRHAREMQDRDLGAAMDRLQANYTNTMNLQDDVQAFEESMQETQNTFLESMQDSRKGHALEMQENQFTHEDAQNVKNREFEQKWRDHLITEYENEEARRPDTHPVTWSEMRANPRMGFGDWWFERSEQDKQEDRNIVLQELQMEAVASGTTLAEQGFNINRNRGEFEDWLALDRQRTLQYQVESQAQFQLMGLMYDQRVLNLQLAGAAGKSPEYTERQMNALLSDPDVIRLYAQGAAMPEVEFALSQKFQTRYDPNSGLIMSPDLPDSWQAAIRERENRGFAAYDYQPPGRQFYNYNQGGPVKKLQGGGDPRGLYEPVTGTYLPRRIREEPVSIDEPIITATGEGIDITAATGLDAALASATNNVVENLTGILGGGGVTPFPEYEKAIRALDSFNQIALVRALGSIAGKENKELQQRLAKLEVPAANWLYGDSKALAQFRTSSRVMDFAIREQQAAIQGPRLTRTERNKALNDLAALQGIKQEYDRMADAFSRKLEGQAEDASSQLDQFFN